MMPVWLNMTEKRAMKAGKWSRSSTVSGSVGGPLEGKAIVDSPKSDPKSSLLSWQKFFVPGGLNHTGKEEDEVIFETGWSETDI